LNALGIIHNFLAESLDVLETIIKPEMYTAIRDLVTAKPFPPYMQNQQQTLPPKPPVPAMPKEEPRNEKGIIIHVKLIVQCSHLTSSKKSFL
jgi:hypothetical protein